MFTTQIISIQKGEKMQKELNNIKRLLQNIEKELKSFSIYSDKPTIQQLKNRQKCRRFWRNFFNDGEIFFPFIVGIMLLGLITFITINNNI